MSAAPKDTLAGYEGLGSRPADVPGEGVEAPVVTLLRSALEEIRGLEPKPFEGGIDWEAVGSCEECQRYTGHPVQQGICNTHRQLMYERERHEVHEEKALGWRARSIARAALEREAAASLSRSVGISEGNEPLIQPPLNHEELVTALEGLARDATAMGWPDDADDLSAAVDVIRHQPVRIDPAAHFAELEAENAELRAALARKDAALRPFVGEQEFDGHATVQDHDMWVMVRVRWSDLVEARQALETKDDGAAS